MEQTVGILVAVMAMWVRMESRLTKLEDWFRALPCREGLGIPVPREGRSWARWRLKKPACDVKPDA